MVWWIREKRGHPAIHPRTPNPYEDMPKRQFDGIVKAWRRSLHKWDNPDYRPAVFNRRDQNAGLGKRKFDDSSTASEEREEGKQSHKRRHSSKAEHPQHVESRKTLTGSAVVFVKEEKEKIPAHYAVHVKEENEKALSYSGVHVKEENEKAPSHNDVHVKEEKEKASSCYLARQMEEGDKADIDGLGHKHSGLAELEEEDHSYSDEDVL